MQKVSILLACYNSSKFLSVQLDSIIGQSYTDWNLYIRDDGSSDNTISIVKQYMDKDGRIHLLEDAQRGLGAGKSFMRLLQNVESDYYFFSDHDDVWMPDKIEVSLNELIASSKDNPDMPIIVHSDLIVVDKDLKTIHSSFWKSSGIKPDTIASSSNIQVFNCVTGCTMAFNRKVKEISFPYPDLAPMHDWWLAICTLRSQGKVVHLRRPLIYYRQHGGNEVGARNVDGGYFMKKLGAIGGTLDGHREQLRFLRSVGGIGAFRYYWIKLWYTMMRKI